MRWAIGWAAGTIFLISFVIIIPDAACSSFVGVVSDPSGAAIQDANVTVTNTDNGASIKTVTNAAGAYFADDPPGGTYSISVEAKKFVNMIKKRIRYVPSGQIHVNFPMTPVNEADVVEIDLSKEAIIKWISEDKARIESGLNKNNTSDAINGDKDTQDVKHEKLLIPADLDIVYAFIGIGKIISIDAQRAYDEIMVVQVGDRQIKISNFCTLIKYESSSPGIQVSSGGKFDLCTRLNSFSQFHAGDNVKITYERGLAQIKLEQAGDKPQ
jgi:hypothetical protein